MDLAILLGIHPKRTESSHVQNSIICYSQKIEATHVMINRQMDEESVLDTDNRISFGLKKRKILIRATTWMKLEGMLNGNKPITKRTNAV